MIKRLLWALALLLAPRLTAAQGPACSDFRVNTHTTDIQKGPSVASAADGSFVVVWESWQQDGDLAGVYGQQYDGAGTAVGSEFPINTATSSVQTYSAVASDPGGNFVVAWSSNAQDGSGMGVFGQRFDSSGSRLGSEFQVNTWTLQGQYLPAVAAHPAGFVVVWVSDQQDGSGYGVFGQRYNAAGVRQGSEFQVNTYTTGHQRQPEVASRDNGEFVVVWVSEGQDGSQTGIFGQRFAADGARVGNEFAVNTFTTSAQQNADVVGDRDGGFVVVWDSYLADGSAQGIAGRRFDASGNPQGAEFLVNAHTTSTQWQPAVTRDSDGGFVVLWMTPGPGPFWSVVGRRLDSAGAPVGPDFAVSSYAGGNQNYPAVAATTAGGFAAIWESDSQDGNSLGVYGSLDCARLYTTAPCRLADTRNPPGPGGGPPLQANSTRIFPVNGQCAIPSDARAVVLNVTAVNPTDGGDLRLYAAGRTAPLASTINFAAGITRANNAVAAVGSAGQIAVQCDMPPGSTGSTHLVLDVYGYFKR